MPVAPPTDRPTSTRSPDAIPRGVEVGQLCEVTQHVTLPGIVTVTRSKALRVSARVIAWHAFSVGAYGALGRILEFAWQTLSPAK